MTEITSVVETCSLESVFGMRFVTLSIIGKNATVEATSNVSVSILTVLEVPTMEAVVEIISDIIVVGSAAIVDERVITVGTDD